MMKKKLLCLILCFNLMLLLCSCGLFGDQEYICDTENVKSIQIVRLDKYVEGEYRFEYTVLSEIPDPLSFIEKLYSVKQSVNWGDPLTLYEGYIVIKVDYLDGGYDLIHADAQWINRVGREQYGFIFFDDDQFNALLSEYIGESYTDNDSIS